MIMQVMIRSVALQSLAPVLATLAACSGGTKPTLKQSPTPQDVVAPKIGIIQSPKFRDECGVSLQLPDDYKGQNEKYIFNGDLAENGQINIDGRDVDLMRAESDEPERELKVGDHFSETYTGDGLKAHIDYVVTGVCDPTDEACEVINLDATITVERNGVKQQVKTSGLLGC
jgi:hypothetical protein